MPEVSLSRRPSGETIGSRAFPRGGSYVKPRLVLQVKSAWGETLYKSEPEYVEAISPQNAFLMVSMLIS